MKGPRFLVAFLTFLLEITAVGLALGAVRHVSVAMTNDITECKYTGSVATGLSTGAVVLLLLGHVIVMATTSCFCCSSHLFDGRPRLWAIVTFILAWISFVLAELSLVAGAGIKVAHITINSSYTYSESDILRRCRDVRRAVFVGGAFLTLLTLLFSELYYIAFTKPREGSWQEVGKYGSSTISMASIS